MDPPLLSPAAEESNLTLDQQREVVLKQEFEFPLDPAIKWELGRIEWCRGARGQAIEHWKWILQFEASSEWAQRARRLTSLVPSLRDEKLAEMLHCAQHAAKK